ncbi:MAG: TPM domain-containing protein [Oscillospiraceae bacterium]
MGKNMRKAASLLLAAVVMVITSLTCFAASGGTYRAVLEDFQSALSGEEETELLDMMYDSADDIGMNIGIIIADDLGSINEEQYCETFVEAYFGSHSDSIVLLLAEEGSGDYDWIYTTGKAASLYDKRRDEIFDAVYYGLDSGASLNFNAACKQFSRALTDISNGNPVAKNNDDIHYMASLTDYQNALSESEETELLALLQSTADSIGVNLGVVLSDSLNGKTEEQYTDDYMYEQFGRDSSSIVLMLVKEGTGNQDIIAFNKHAYDVYDSKYNAILDAVYSGLDSGISPNYPAAISKFCSYLENHQTSYGKGFEFHFGMGQLIAIAISAVIALVAVNVHAGSYKKKAPISARQYLVNNRTNFTLRQDIYVREFTTSHRISSSSGGSHGGGGGHSRSGGHSSHGGRHR